MLFLLTAEYPVSLFEKHYGLYKGSFKGLKACSRPKGTRLKISSGGINEKGNIIFSLYNQSNCIYTSNNKRKSRDRADRIFNQKFSGGYQYNNI
jgi:hypothetical protein